MRFRCEHRGMISTVHELFGKFKSTVLFLVGFLWIGLSILQSASSSNCQALAGSWLFDLISLTQSQGHSGSPHVSPYEQYVPPPYPGVGHSGILYDQPNPHGRKSVRETSNNGKIYPSSVGAVPPGDNQLQFTPSDISSHLQGSVTAPVTKPNALSFNDRGNLLAQEAAICHALTGLTANQRHICLQHSGLVWAMLEGTQLGLHECVHQFQNEQWNCSAVNLLYQVSPSNIPAVGGLEGILQRGSRETAFLSSAWSAGVVQAITRACSRGQMGTCDCDPHRREGQDRDAEGIFTWGGCSDPIRFGMKLTRLFLDANDRENRQSALMREEQLHGPKSSPYQKVGRHRYARRRKPVPGYVTRYTRSASTTSYSVSNSSRPRVQNGNKDNFTDYYTGPDPQSLTPQQLQSETFRIMQTKARVLMNLHNRRAGRRLVWKNRVRKCKCHGVSGACSMRTCWQRVNEFRFVGSMLKAAYDSAVRVTYEPRTDSLKPIRSSTQSLRAFTAYGSESFLGTGLVTGFGHPLSRHRTVQHDWNMQTPREEITSPGNLDEYSSDFWEQRRYPRNAHGSRKLSKGKLIYLEESPNYCRYDPSIGHLGIGGRLCNGTNDDAANSCKRLCCDRGYDTFEVERQRKCECKFFWCCEVRCRVCTERKVEHRCKH
ncbi:unnamed protein product [Calicophoron daubneyi]|uniref:Protein Wnt n=1 Tax=Calicophoron daubneyi TaxID=300641 RepID=A0AAV2TR00_CALDB